MSKWGKCVVCGREDRYKANGMCTKHYDQWYKYGKVLDNNPRNQKDPNEIVIHDDYAEIILYEGKTCYEVDRALIDLDDIEKVKKYKWCLNKKREKFVTTKDGYFLHTLIMDCPKDKSVMHINGNNLDNRKSNLRILEQTKRKRNEVTRKKMSEAKKGKNYSEEHKAKISKAMSEAKKGKTLTDEHKQKIGKSKKGKGKVKIYCVELDKYFDTVTEASKFIGCTKQNISNVLKGKGRTAGGYHWEYAEIKTRG